jgi:hypothetical protein
VVVEGAEMAGGAAGVEHSGDGARAFGAFGVRALEALRARVRCAPGSPRSTTVASTARVRDRDRSD